MNDDVLASELAAWLHDSDVVAPDPQAGTDHVMASTAGLPQLRRWWPPSATVPPVRPVPVVTGNLAAPAPVQPARPRSSRSTKGVRTMFSASRLAIGTMLAVCVGLSALVAVRSGPDGSGSTAPAGPSAAAAAPTPTLGPSLEARSPAQGIDWRSGGIALTADAFALTIGDRVFSASGETLPLGITYADHGQLELWWIERDSLRRLIIELGIDDTHWWIDLVRAYETFVPDPEWRDLASMTRTAIGESLEGDLELVTALDAPDPYDVATLRFDGLTLTAFEPGSRPAPLTGCDYVEDPRIEVSWDEEGSSWSTSVSGRPLQGRGEPLEGAKRMTPREVEAILQDLGLCHVFQHSWKPTPQFDDPRLDRELEGYFDRRCSAPRTGKVTEVYFGPDSSGRADTIVYIRVRETEERDWPEPPSAGTDCPSQ